MVARSPGVVNRRLLAAGAFAGAAVGIWARRKARDFEATGEVPLLIDWERARAVAVTMNRAQGLGLAERARLGTVYRELVERCLPPIAEYTGSRLTRPFDAVMAFDRVDWVGANTANFATMFAPLEELNPLRGQRPKVASVLWGSASQAVLSSEVGLLLGYLARRVLGQYDLALLGKEPITDGKLYFVEPNIRHVQQSLGLPLEDFRMWLALHETTHVFEFEAHPWVRAHLNAILEQYFEFLSQDVATLKEGGLAGLKLFLARAKARGGLPRGNWIELLMTPAQRELFSQMQATMAIVEGYSNHVMNVVGRQLLPSFDQITRQIEKRQREKSVAEQIFIRLTGLDMKLEQYRLGETFIDQVVALRGHELSRRVWESAATMPSLAEVRAPKRWIERMDRTPVATSRSTGDAPIPA